MQVSYEVGRFTSHCSGVTLDHNSYITILTCSHLFRDEKPDGKFVVRFANETRHSAWLLGVDHTLDLALLAVSRPHTRGIKLATQPPKVGDIVTTWGWTHRQPQTITQGPILYYEETSNTTTMSYLRARGVSSPGRSGGPILDSQGRVVSVLWGSGTQGIQGVRFDYLQFFLKEVFARHGLVSPDNTPETPLAAEQPPVCAPETPENGPICDPNGLLELIRANSLAIAALTTREPLQGETGETGIQGKQGPKGEQGIPGERGSRGLEGLRGAEGTKGARGDKGEPGEPFRLSDVTDAEVLEFAARLPMITLQTIKAPEDAQHTAADRKRISELPPGGVIQETRGRLGGTPLRLRFVPVSPKESN